MSFFIICLASQFSNRLLGVSITLHYCMSVTSVYDAYFSISTEMAFWG